MELKYQEEKGIPIERVDTHLLQGRGANGLSLNGYSNTQIQKMGRWTGESIKEYIRSELAEFSKGTSKAMQKCIGYMVGLGGAHHDVPKELAELAISV